MAERRGPTATLKGIAKKGLSAGPTLARRRGRRVVLCYHSISDHTAFADLTPAAFDDHLDWLADHTNVVSLADLAATHDDERIRVALTFDDGYRDNYTEVLPRLLSRGWPATFFITTGLIEGNDPVREHFAAINRAPLEQIEGMSWSEVKEVMGEGMEIGAHTITHRNLAALEPNTVLAELAGSKQLLEDRLGIEVSRAAYPFGRPRQHVDQTVEASARAAGFSEAFAINFRPVANHPTWSIPRFTITGDDVALLAAKVEGRLDALGWWQATAPAWALRRVAFDPSAV